MNAEVLQFPLFDAATPPIAQFVRIGDAHNKIGELHAAGRLPLKRAVFEASRLKHQKQLIEVFRSTGIEIVLDPQTAELSALSKFSGQVRFTPWASYGNGTPISPYDFAGTLLKEICAEIARTAIEFKFDVCLAPTHYLADRNYDGWLKIDRKACLQLRYELDSRGGSDISIDFPILHSHVALNQADVRSNILAAIDNLPIDYVWIRPSGLEGDSGPLQIKQFLNALASLHNTGKPIILDQIGGYTALAPIAFGLASGKSHGIGDRERFNASNWHKPAKEIDKDSAFGRTARISIPGLRRSLTRNEVEFLSKAKGGKRLLGCGDRACCLHGFTDMIEDHRSHLAYQTFKDIREIERVPVLRRGNYFIEGSLRDSVRKSGDVSRLNPPEKCEFSKKVNVGGLRKRLSDHHKKIVNVEKTLIDFSETHESFGQIARPVGVPRTRTTHKRQEIQ